MILNTKTQDEIDLDEVRAADRRFLVRADQPTGTPPRISAVRIDRPGFEGHMMPQLESFITTPTKGSGLLSLSLHVFGQN